MAKIKSNNFELEFLVMECCDFDPIEFYFKIILKYKGVSVLNDRAMKRHNSYWKKGKKGGIIGSEIDTIRLIGKLEKALLTKEAQFWEPYPDPDVQISVYPNRNFPNIQEEYSDHLALIVSPNSYQFKDSLSYDTYEGVSFVLTPTREMILQFIEDLKWEVLEEARKTFGKKHYRTNVYVTTDKTGKIIKKRKLKVTIEPCEVNFDDNYFLRKK